MLDLSRGGKMSKYSGISPADFKFWHGRSWPRVCPAPGGSSVSAPGVAFQRLSDFQLEPDEVAVGDIHQLRHLADEVLLVAVETAVGIGHFPEIAQQRQLLLVGE